MNKSLFTCSSDEWATPSKLYAKFMHENYFDPCPMKRDFDGLLIEWKEKNFVNPPYSHLKEWINKALIEHAKGREVVLLIPARTDTNNFARLWEYGVEIQFIKGRLHFNDKGTAPFPSMLVKLTGKPTICYLRKDLK